MSLLATVEAAQYAHANIVATSVGVIDRRENGSTLAGVDSQP
jgi:hypothetical protein